MQTAAGGIAQTEVVNAPLADVRGGGGEAIGRQGKFIHHASVRGHPPFSTCKIGKNYGQEVLMAS